MKRKLLVFISFMLFTSSLHALSLSEIRTQIRRAIRDNPSDTARRRFSDDFILGYVNEAQKEITNALWLGEQTTYYALRANTTYYNLPQNLLAISQVVYTNGNLSLLLQQATRRPLYEKDPSWAITNRGGTPLNYYVSPATSPVAQTQTPLKISYIPIPTNSSGTVTIWFIYRFEDLASDSDVPFNGYTLYYNYHFALVYKVAMHLHQIMGNDKDVQFYTALYRSSLELTKDRISRMPDYMPGFSASPKQ